MTTLADVLKGTPHQRMRQSGAMMAEQYNRPTPQDGQVVERAGLLPLGVYDNGQAGIAWPGMFAGPVQSFNQLFDTMAQPGVQSVQDNPQIAEDAFNAAGGAAIGGLGATRPAGSLGSNVVPFKRSGLGAKNSASDFEVPLRNAMSNPNVTTEQVIESAQGLLKEMNPGRFPFVVPRYGQGPDPQHLGTGMLNMNAALKEAQQATGRPPVDWIPGRGAVREVMVVPNGQLRHRVGPDQNYEIMLPPDVPPSQIARYLIDNGLYSNPSSAGAVGLMNQYSGQEQPAMPSLSSVLRNAQ